MGIGARTVGLRNTKERPADGPRDSPPRTAVAARPSRLVAALGPQPLWEELSVRGDTRAPSGPGITVGGRTAELPWFAIETTNEAPATKRLAQRGARIGRPCLVL